MGVPKICLYVMLLNEKYVELRINLTAPMNSTMVIGVLSEIRFPLLTMLCMAKSDGTFVKSEITSSDAIPDPLWYHLVCGLNDSCFFIKLGDSGMLFLMMLYKKMKSS